MMTTVGYEAWYNKHAENQVVAQPIEFTLEGIDALLRDDNVSPAHKVAAREFLRRTKRKTWASNAFAVICALGAAFSSIAYFMAMREHELAFNEYLIAPLITGLFVAAATWYTYRHDTDEWFLDFHFNGQSLGLKQLCVVFLTLAIVAMEVVLSGYGVAECLPKGNFEIGMIAFVCGAALIPELAQTYKYLDKWINDSREKYDWNKFKDKRFAGYMLCSTIMLAFCGMAIFPLLEDTLSTSGALLAVAAYVVLGLPYLWKKSEEQIKSQDTPAQKTQSSAWPFRLSRIGSGIGDLAFSAYGFFETMKMLGLINKPIDTFDSLDAGCSEAWKPWLILLAAVVVVASSSVGSFLMTAGGNDESYGTKIARVEGVPIHSAQVKSTEEKPPPSPVIFSSIWHKTSDAPRPLRLKITSSVG